MEVAMEVVMVVMEEEMTIEMVVAVSIQSSETQGELLVCICSLLSVKVLDQQTFSCMSPEDIADI